MGTAVGVGLGESEPPVSGSGSPPGVGPALLLEGAVRIVVDEFGAGALLSTVTVGVRLVVLRLVFVFRPVGGGSTARPEPWTGAGPCRVCPSVLKEKSARQNIAAMPQEILAKDTERFREVIIRVAPW